MIKAKIIGSKKKMQEKAFQDCVKDVKEEYDKYKKHTAWLHEDDISFLFWSVLAVEAAITLLIELILFLSFPSLKSLTSFGIVFCTGISISALISCIICSSGQRKCRKELADLLRNFNHITWKEFMKPQYSDFDWSTARKDALKLINQMTALQDSKKMLKVSMITSDMIEVTYADTENTVKSVCLKNVNLVKKLDQDDIEIVLNIDDAGDYQLNLILDYDKKLH